MERTCWNTALVLRLPASCCWCLCRPISHAGEKPDCARPRLNAIRLISTYTILGPELSGQRGAHENAALRGGGLEVSLAALGTRRSQCCRGLSVNLYRWLIGETRAEIANGYRGEGCRIEGERVRTGVADSHLDGATWRVS